MLAINGADLAVRGTAWLAMATYFVGALLLLKTPGPTPRFRGLRWIWAAGCEFYLWHCLLYTSPSPRDGLLSRMPSSA